MNCIHVLLFGLLTIAALMCMNTKEKFTKLDHRVPIVGDQVSHTIQFKNSSTLVDTIIGNNGKTIILLHDTPFDSQVFDLLHLHAQNMVSQGKQVPTLISYDLLGHGVAWVPVDAKYENTDNNYAWTVNDYTSNLFDIYNLHVTGKVTLVGYGFGGFVAQAFALEHPGLIEQLYLITCDINPSGIKHAVENDYLINWINNNKTVPFLTFEKDYIKSQLCKWFTCSEGGNDTDSIAYILTDKMYREGNVRVLLQTNKLLKSENLMQKWSKTPATFPIIALFANNDAFIDYNNAVQNIHVISKSAKVYLVNGKHNFPLINTEYIYDLILGNDMTKNKLTIN